MTINNVKIYAIKNEIEVTIDYSASDMLTTFILIKNLCSWAEYFPTSIYRITSESKNITMKTKSSMNFFRRMDFDEFIDNFESTTSNLLTPSGEFQKKHIIGWEIRYKTNIPLSEFEMKINDIKTGIWVYRENILKKND